MEDIYYCCQTSSIKIVQNQGQKHHVNSTLTLPSSPSYFTADHIKRNIYCNILLSHFPAFQHSLCFNYSQLQKILKFSPDMLQNDNENQTNILIKKFYAECIIHFFIKFIAIANNIPMGCAEELKSSMVSTFNIERMPIVKFKVQKVHRFLNI